MPHRAMLLPCMPCLLVLAVLLAPLVTAECVESMYDQFLGMRWERDKQPETMSELDLSRSALLVVDMQADFTYGSFGLPCYSTDPRVKEFTTKVAQFMVKFSSRGGVVLATKDWHPSDHCSFNNTLICKNKYRGREQPYENNFPSHCAFDPETGKPIPHELPFTAEYVEHDEFIDFINSRKKREHHGSDFVDEVSFALHYLMESPDRKTAIAYKGFHPEYESFSAFPMADGGAEEAKWTGAYLPISLEGDMDDYYPSPTDLADPEHRMLALGKFLTYHQVEHVYVVGLVYDFCVRDTALFARLPQNLGPHVGVTVVVDLTRPALDRTALTLPGPQHTLASAEQIVSTSGALLAAGVQLMHSDSFIFW